MPIIDVHSLSFSFTAQPLLGAVSFSVGDNERACVVGPNGCGKTTLLQIIAGKIAPDAGTAQIRGLPKGAQLSAPAAATMAGTVDEYLNLALGNLYDIATRFDHAAEQLAKRQAHPALVAQYDELLATMSAHDIWSLDVRIDETLAGLGLPHLVGKGRFRPCSELSPGQAGRLELAATLLMHPPVLVLDEPTNHLDANAVKFLTRMLKQRSGPLLMASHDRAFIEEVATVIYDLDTAAWQALATAGGSGLLPGVYKNAGTYSNFLQAKEQARKAHRELHASQQATKRSLLSHRRESRGIASGGVRLATAEGMAKKFFADRAQATSVRRSRNDDKRLENLAQREVRKPRYYDLRLPLKPVKNRVGVTVMARDAVVSGQLTPVTFDLNAGEHLLITGPNGAGKSTLLRWMMNGQPPAEAVGTLGKLSVAGRVSGVVQRLPRVGDSGMTKKLWESGIGDLGTGVVHPAMWNTPIPDLSAGNQRRVQLALAMLAKPDVLIIDEPTNYLDLDAIEALENALLNWNGTLVIASHDRWLIEKWFGRRMFFERMGTENTV